MIAGAVATIGLFSAVIPPALAEESEPVCYQADQSEEQFELAADGSSTRSPSDAGSETEETAAADAESAEQSASAKPAASAAKRTYGPGEVVWVGDVETGDLSQFDDAPWNTQEASEPEVVTNEARDGSHSVRMAIPAGASTDNGGGPRSELVPSTPHFRSGDELFFAYSTMLEEGFPTHDSWQNIAAWKADPGGSPPLEMGVEDGQYVLSGGWGHPHGSQNFVESLGDAAPGSWADWVIHIKFSVAPGEGFVEVWRDGQIVVPRMHPAGGTLYPVKDPDGNLYPPEYQYTDGEPRGYPKIGYYRKSGISSAGAVYFDSMAVGTSYSAVAR